MNNRVLLNNANENTTNYFFLEQYGVVYTLQSIDYSAAVQINRSDILITVDGVEINTILFSLKHYIMYGFPKAEGIWYTTEDEIDKIILYKDSVNIKTLTKQAKVRFTNITEMVSPTNAYYWADVDFIVFD